MYADAAVVSPSLFLTILYEHSLFLFSCSLFLVLGYFHKPPTARAQLSLPPTFPSISIYLLHRTVHLHHPPFSNLLSPFPSFPHLPTSYLLPFFIFFILASIGNNSIGTEPPVFSVGSRARILHLNITYVASNRQTDFNLNPTVRLCEA